jgi:hypothetical protein
LFPSINDSLDEFLRRRAKLVRVTDAVHEKQVRGFFQTLYWRRQFLAQRSQSSTSGSAQLPSIVVEESETSLLSVPRAGMPSLDLTQMRNLGSPTRPAFGQQDRLQVQGSSRSESDDESDPHGRTWGNLGAPDSQLSTTTGQSEL